MKTPLDFWAETGQVSEVLHRRFDQVIQANIAARLEASDERLNTGLWFWSIEQYDPHQMLRLRHRRYVEALLHQRLRGTNVSTMFQDRRRTGIESEST
jgi:hypothetical protein